MCLSAASGDVQAYQIRTAPTSTITPGVVMATSPALGTGTGTEEVTRKREVRLMKNRYVYYEVGLPLVDAVVYRKCFSDLSDALETRLFLSYSTCSPSHGEEKVGDGISVYIILCCFHSY